jgi:hypothetical protein
VSRRAVAHVTPRPGAGSRRMEPAVVLIDADEVLLDAAASPMTSLLNRRSRGRVLHRPLDLRSVPPLCSTNGRELFSRWCGQ